MFWCRLAPSPLSLSPLRCRLITFAPMDKRHLMTQSCQQWVEAKSAKEIFCSTQCFTHFSNGAKGQRGSWPPLRPFATAAASVQVGQVQMSCACAMALSTFLMTFITLSGLCPSRSAFHLPPLPPLSLFRSVSLRLRQKRKDKRRKRRRRRRGGCTAGGNCLNSRHV